MIYFLLFLKPPNVRNILKEEKEVVQIDGPKVRKVLQKKLSVHELLPHELEYEEVNILHNFHTPSFASFLVLVYTHKHSSFVGTQIKI